MAGQSYLLDTHAWIWVIEGKAEIAGSSIVRRIEAASETNLIYISAISPWEVGMLEAKRRLRFTLPCLQWVLSALEAPGITLAPVDPYIAVESSFLPGEFHGDPADRIIVATARRLGATLISRDREILDYAAAGYVKAEAI